MDELKDNFSEVLDAQIKALNSNKMSKSPLDTLVDRMDRIMYCMAVIEQSFFDLHKFKESHRFFDLKEVINYDYKLSYYANRFYTPANQVIDLIQKNKNMKIIDAIAPEKKVKFAKLAYKTLLVSARWHIERMINVYEADTPIENRAFPKRKPLLEECIFFADRMNATKMGIKFNDGMMPKMIIFAVQPSSGKSFIANVYSLMSLCLHAIYHKTSGILRMSNNSANAEGFADQIKSMIENEKIAEIYPEFTKYFSTGKPKILDKTPSGEWRMAGLDPRIRASHFARGRETAINSIRVFVGLVIDDLSDGFDQMKNDEAHQEMTRKYYVDMESRGEGEDLPVFLLGTMFNEFDIQNSMINKLEVSVGLIKDEKFRNVRRTPDYSTIVIEVDCFDEKGESIAPKLISTAKLKDRQNSLKPFEFDLVYRQFRSSREPRPFDYGNLKTYKKLPETLNPNRIAVLDPTRKNGEDFFSLPVLAEDTDSKLSYFVNCIYEQKSLGLGADPKNRFFAKVVKFLIDNNVRKLVIENNTSNTIGTMFKEKFEQLNYHCIIDEIYTSKTKGFKNKTERILHQEATIVENIVFPAQGLYPPLHHMALFMTDFTRYDSKQTSTKKQHDDAPDSLRLYADKFLYANKNRYSCIESTFGMKNLWKN